MKKNESSINDLSTLLAEQVELYNSANKLPDTLSIEDDTDHIRDTYSQFYASSQQFVDRLVEIKKNTLAVLEGIPKREGWLLPQEDDDWDTFVSDVCPKYKPH